MWILLFFDLPTHHAAHRKAYSMFKKTLKKLRFHRLQYSVYVRYTADNQDSIIKKVLNVAPREGDIKMIPIPNQAYQKLIHLQNGQQRNHSWKASLLFW